MSEDMRNEEAGYEACLHGGHLLPLVEDFYTLQGEGFHTGTAAWFIRLGGCDVGCRWCDARETWNPRIYPPVEVYEIVRRATLHPAKVVVVTGGEPLMYPLGNLCGGLHAEGMDVHLETSGSHPFSGEFDWVCLSPKRRQPPLDEAWDRADELKVIIETADDLLWAEECAEKVEKAKAARLRSAYRPNHSALVPYGRKTSFGKVCVPYSRRASLLSDTPHAAQPKLFLQPEWSRRNEMMPVVVEYIKNNPRWRASLQAHKYMRIP